MFIMEGLEEEEDEEEVSCFKVGETSEAEEEDGVDVAGVVVAVDENARAISVNWSRRETVAVAWGDPGRGRGGRGGRAMNL